MIDTLSENYFRTARAKGLSRPLILRRHALRPALTPITTIFGMDFAGLLGGALITETVFGLNGIGKMAADSIAKNDQPVIMAVTLLAAFFVVIGNVVVDLVYTALDPRVRSDVGMTDELFVVEDLTVTLPTTPWAGGRGEERVVHRRPGRHARHRRRVRVGQVDDGLAVTRAAATRRARRTGSIRLDGTELLGRSERELRRCAANAISMVFQDPLSSLNPYYTVGLQIEEMYRAHRGGSRRAARQVAIEALDQVGIPDPGRRVDHYPHQFSGGQRQRVMIAMALCCSPALLIADEPTTALDVTVQAQILELLAELQSTTGTGMVFITHDLAVISSIAQRVLVMCAGEPVEYGTAEQVFSDPRHEYTRTLLDAVPRIDDEVVACVTLLKVRGVTKQFVTRGEGAMAPEVHVHRGRRRQLRGGAGRDAGDRGRVGQREVDHRADRGPAAGADERVRSSSTGRT